LEALSYTRVLERGFALVSDAAGHPITAASAIKPGDRLRLRLADGEVRATADGGKAGTRQGSLPL
jgi:exodeoxyribonuclease VII large subunit